MASVNKNVIVVVTCPGAVLTPWRKEVQGILVNFMPGQEIGNAMTEILFGEHNPSARLPITFPTKENEQEFTKEQYPGVNRATTYSEGLFVGYRWYDKKGVEPAFPFGHGLSYTKFTYDNLKISNRKVSVDVKNVGGVDGDEVA